MKQFHSLLSCLLSHRQCCTFFQCFPKLSWCLLDAFRSLSDLEAGKQILQTNFENSIFQTNCLAHKILTILWCIISHKTVVSGQNSFSEPLYRGCSERLNELDHMECHYLGAYKSLFEAHFLCNALECRKSLERHSSATVPYFCGAINYCEPHFVTLIYALFGLIRSIWL